MEKQSFFSETSILKSLPEIEKNDHHGQCATVGVVLQKKEK